MTINFYPNNIISYPTAVKSQMINSIDQELKMAITGNHCERIKELLNSNLDAAVSSKLRFYSLSSLEEGQLSEAEVILNSNSFYDIPISDLKKIFFDFTEHVISKGLQNHLQTFLSSYDYTREELKNKSPKNLEWIFNGKLGSMLGYIN